MIQTLGGAPYFGKIGKPAVQKADIDIEEAVASMRNVPELKGDSDTTDRVERAMRNVFADPQFLASLTAIRERIRRGEVSVDDVMAEAQQILQAKRAAQAATPALAFGSATAIAKPPLISADTLETVLADDDVKKALQAFRDQLQVAGSEATTAKKGSMAKAKPWLSLVGALLMAVFGAVFGKAARAI